MIKRDITPLAKLLDDYITDSNIPATEIARDLEVDRREIYRWRRGLHEPSALNLYLITQYLKIPPQNVNKCLSECTCI